ncbi:MAG: amidohydrolase family protein [Roseivivax sp.]|nr:amidohydrolase family protein [Roseivivax sp.]
MIGIDAHHHFWHPARGDYGWMPADDPVLTRPYGPADLAPGLAATGVSRTVLVQAAPTVEETEYLLGIADSTPHVAGVVGWIDFEDASQRAVLRRLSAHPKFLGVRPMIQDLPDDGWMLRDDIRWAFETLEALDLTFDCLGFPRHMAHFHTLLTRHPNLRAVLDHCLKPQLRAHSAETFAFWAKGMERLAQDTAATVKLSGIVTEDDTMPGDDRLEPYLEHVLQVFGPHRVMWGSDWPVSRLRCDYATWHATARRLTAHLDAAGQAAVFGGTAARFYRLA